MIEEGRAATWRRPGVVHRGERGGGKWLRGVAGLVGRA
jgi:hypothetical protein